MELWETEGRFMPVDRPLVSSRQVRNLKRQASNLKRQASMVRLRALGHTLLEIGCLLGVGPECVARNLTAGDSRERGRRRRDTR